MYWARTDSCVGIEDLEKPKKAFPKSSLIWAVIGSDFKGEFNLWVFSAPHHVTYLIVVHGNRLEVMPPIVDAIGCLVRSYSLRDVHHIDNPVV